MSRSEAKDAVGIDKFRESMKGIYSSSVMESTIDESPMEYKPMEEIMENIKDTVDIVKVIKRYIILKHIRKHRLEKSRRCFTINNSHILKMY